MRDKTTLLSSSAILVILLVAGIFYVSNHAAVSQQPQDMSLTDQGFDPDLYSLQDLSPASGMIVAAANCGSETCSSEQCCCLNTDTGAQCCRPNKSGNCVESCKRSAPC